ncbi:MAG: aspartate/glutamate racemase family protein [Desulfurococcales archaeon]|nr:aspartate/glutamate racemase family protein [Desulfurococcales archaeon]
MARTIRLLDLVPIVYTESIKAAIRDREGLAKRLEDETNGLVKMDVATLEKGTASIESAFDEYVNAPYMLKKIKWAEDSGYDAVVIDCFGDPALDAAREIVGIPVVGANHASTFLAAQVAQRFSIINILPETEPLVRSLLAKYGLLGHLASIETINVPVLELEREPKTTLDRIVEAAERAYRDHGAYAVVLGCTGMSSLAEMAQERLREKGIDIPVIEPLRAAVYTAISWVLMGVSHSREAYKPPRPKARIVDFDLP